ncbi:MAG: hypothetical protein U0930_23820 [Pirellulales bacterium]
MKDARGALQAVLNETGPIPDIIRMHAYGEQAQQEECRRMFASLEKQKNRGVVELRSLLHDGYLSEKAIIVRTEAWTDDVFQKELQLILMNAA